MNFKRNCSLIISLVTCALSISGCSSGKAFSRYNAIFDETVISEDEVGTGYVKKANFESYKAYNKNNELVSLGSAYQVTSNNTGRHPFEPYCEEQKPKRIIVVPVQFPDFTAYTLNVKTETYIENLNKVFFGTSDCNRYVSVAEYYNVSSYHKVAIDGFVCDKFYTYAKTVTDIKLEKLGDKDVRNERDHVINWFNLNYPENTENFNDKNTAIFLVYTYPVELNGGDQSFFWAFTFQDCRFCWASYSMMNTVSGEPDAHTFIHETGHLFGLRDYYPTIEGSPEPTACIDMMDCSVGDQTAFSKLYLGWAKPYYINGDCEINLNPLIKKGEVILINDHWNGTIFDEYYLIEFYSPLGLNHFDTINGNNKAKLPNLPGIKIYHVDARLGYYTTITKKVPDSTPIFAKYCDEPAENPGDDGDGFNPESGNISFAHNNSTYPVEEGGTPVTNKYLYELKLNHADSVTTKTYAKNLNLYHTGDVFKAEEFVFNKDNDTKYNVSISGMTYESATIKIEKV